MKGRAINLGLLSVSKDELHKVDVADPHLGKEGTLKQKKTM